MSRRPYIGPSESEVNAQALARRSSPYTVESEWSAKIAWDWHRREPTDLRDAVRMARKAYSDEVPDKLHDGPDVIGDDGTPRMTARAVGYIMGSAVSDDAGRDAESGERDLMGYYHAPFRAALANLAAGSEAERHRGRIVQCVTIGGQGPYDAAVKEGVPPWCAKLVAEDALRSFLRSLTDVRLHLRRIQEDTAGVA